ncbi:replication protein, partial [Escherichia coli]|nr:replication protein [Escherichia coli]
DKDIGVMFNPVRSTAQFSNLQRCGSLWACPVCANQISQKRKQEVGQAVNAHRKNGGDIVMLTLTTPHQYHDELSMILDMQSMA